MTRKIPFYTSIWEIMCIFIDDIDLNKMPIFWSLFFLSSIFAPLPTLIFQDIWRVCVCVSLKCCLFSCLFTLQCKQFFMHILSAVAIYCRCKTDALFVWYIACYSFYCENLMINSLGECIKSVFEMCATCAIDWTWTNEPKIVVSELNAGFSMDLELQLFFLLLVNIKKGKWIEIKLARENVQMVAKVSRDWNGLWRWLVLMHPHRRQIQWLCKNCDLKRKEKTGDTKKIEWILK